MIRIKNNGKTYTVSYYHNNKLVWCENEIIEKSARVYGLELPENGETIDHNTNWRAVYLIDVKDNMRLYYVIEGLSSLIKSLRRKLKKDNQPFYISDNNNLNGMTLYDAIKLG